MTDLESDIDTLRQLDILRVDSAQLRDEGKKALTALLQHATTLDILKDVLPVSVALWELSSAPPDKVKNDLMQKLGTLDLKDIVACDLSILTATDVMYALVAAPGSPFTQSLLYCYYLIIRELYTADSPDWVVGGARASLNGGMVSAYMTRKCVHALLGLVHALEHTGTFIARVSAIQKGATRLRNMQDTFPELERWTLVEAARLTRALHTMTHTSSPPLVFQPPTLPELTDITIDTIEAYVEDIAKRLNETIENIVDTFTSALSGIDAFRNGADGENSRCTSDEEKTRFRRAEAGHFIAESALQRGSNNTKHIRNDILVLNWHKDFKKWGELEEEVKKVATQIRGLLHPVTNFLSLVLDRELGLAAGGGGSYGESDITEMACAAAAHGAVTNDWGDDRLHRVVECLTKVISVHGRFPRARPYHVSTQRGSTIAAIPPNSAVIFSLAEMFKEAGARATRLKQPIAVPVDSLLVEKILRFFADTTRADKPITENGEKGWCRDYLSPPSHTEASPTAIAVQSLALINRMLDEQINARILYYFSVKQPEEFKKVLGPDLDTIFYPDYGLDLPEVPDHRKSIAIFLQKMRAHVGGWQGADRLHSLVLHGPQGTGKTTIVEALALSCEVPLVEVTPSDIVVKGEEAVERRARTVFEALSLLTRVVILFDEFDPVLWRREPLGDRPSNVFAFLTPGMLPKLRTLYKTAEKRSVAYILITNLIGSLDEPTIREGRFDKRVGIYPPDLLSRTGRFLSEVAVLMEEDPPSSRPSAEVLEDRLVKIIRDSRGAGMQGLNRKGYFTRPGNKERPPVGTPLYYFIWGGREPEPPGKDAELEGVKGHRTREAVREYKQWAWVQTWDQQFESEGLKALTKPPDIVPEEPTEKKKSLCEKGSLVKGSDQNVLTEATPRVQSGSLSE